MIAFINSKKGEGEAYSIQISLVVSEFKIFGLLSLLEGKFCIVTVHVVLLTFIILWFQV